MREIITLQIGGCGNQIGETFWDVISYEHGIQLSNGMFAGTSQLQLERLNVYFNETSHGSFYARALAIDTDRSSAFHLASSNVSSLFNPELFVVGSEGTANNFARGYYTEGAELLDTILNTVRLQAESVDSLQGFQIIHSIGGGTGSGLGSLLIGALAQEYPQQLVSTFTVIPSQRISSVVVEPYNSILSFPQLIENTHLTFCIDNEALYNICHRNLKLPGATLQDLNHIVAHTMSGVTTCLRFPGQLNSGLRKLYVNMVPFPQLHFLVPGFAPLTSCHQSFFMKQTVRELVQHLFKSDNMLAEIDFRRGKLLTVAAIFRGLMSPKEVDEQMTNLRNRNLEMFVDWIPNNIKTAICDIPPRGLKISSTFIGNTTAVKYLFKRVAEAFTVMLRRKAHLHWYTGEGMDEQEFAEALDALNNILKDYEDCAVSTGDEENEENVCSWCSGE